jgi:hypothetical protein
VALTKLSSAFTDIMLKNRDKPPTCINEQMREQVTLIQRIYRNNPKAADAVKEQIKKEPQLTIFDVEHMRAKSQEFIVEINDFMQGYRILCVSTHKDSEKMWTGYAQNHEGIVLRIEPKVEKDSKFQRFFPVRYAASRPSLYDDTLAFLEGALFGDQQATRLAMLDKIIYSKTLEWEHESEYRLAIPLRQGEREWNTMPYHPEEITELYLGRAMTEASKEDSIGKAKGVNPNIAIFQTSCDADQRLTFQRLSK